jgi:hypothetical protein
MCLIKENAMSRNKFVVVLSVLVVSMLLLMVGPVTAQTPAVAGATWPYAAHLADPAGLTVADGKYDFVFTLYAAEKDEQALWSEMQSGVSVKNGEISTALGLVVPFPATISSKLTYWLAVSVRGPNEKTFTLLNPRQSMSAEKGVIGTVNVLTCPHTHFTDYWGGTNGQYGLEVDNTGTGDGIRAFSKATLSNYAALYAYNLATTGYGSGVYGGSSKGVGVYAFSESADALEAVTNSTTKSAIYAHSTAGNGVWAVSGSRQGVHGSSTSAAGVWGDSTSSYGVEGYNSHDDTATGNYGGFFTSNNYRGGFIGTLKTAMWYGAAIDGGLMVTNGTCIGCTLAYVGMNSGEDAIRPGDLVAIAGVKTDAGTGQPVMLISLAKNAGDAVVGVAVGGVSAPGSAGPDKNQSTKIAGGEYVQIAVTGLVQMRVADQNVTIGGYLLPGPSGAVMTAEKGSSVVRVMSLPDENGMVWVMVSGS